MKRSKSASTFSALMGLPTLAQTLAHIAMLNQ